MNRNVMGLIVKTDDGSEKINYDNDYFPSYVYDGWLEPGVSWANVAHFHEDVEFITVKSGTMGYHVNGKNIYLSRGDTIFVNSGQVHYSFATQDEKCCYIIYILHPSILNAGFVVEDEYVNPIIKNEKLEYIVFREGTPENEYMKKYAEELLEAIGDELATSAIFYNLWRIIYGYAREQNLLKTGGESNSLLHSFKIMLAYIHNNYYKHITLDDVAEAANVSRTYCNQLFKRFTGQAPMENLLRFRAERVAAYLRTSDLQMTEIADKTGFSGASYMAEIFKKVYGISPKGFRKNAIR